MPREGVQCPHCSVKKNPKIQQILKWPVPMACSLAGAVGEHCLFTQPLDSPALNFTPFFLSRLRQENESQYQLAALQCHSSKECIYDSLSTGNLALGLATQSLAADFQQRKTALSKWSTSSPLRGHGLDVTGQCSSPFLGSCASYETEEKSPRSWICTAQLACLQSREMPSAGQLPPRFWNCISWNCISGFAPNLGDATMLCNIRALLVGSHDSICLGSHSHQEGLTAKG